MRCKKGSHVGVVLSLVVFITFLIFLYSIIEPVLKTQKDKEVSLNQIEEKLIESFSAELHTALISINKTYNPKKPNPPGEDYKCLEFQKRNLSIESTDSLKIIVKNADGSQIGAGFLVDYFRINWDNSWSDNQRIFRIFFTGQPLAEQMYESDCIEPSGNYSIGQIKTENYVFEDKIFDALFTDYDNFKKKLMIKDEFEFSFTNSTGNVTDVSEELNLSTNIYIREVPIQYIRNDAEIHSGFINIKTW